MFTAETVKDWLQLIRAVHLEMPGLRLTSQQVQRFLGLDCVMCETLLDALVDVRSLDRTSTSSTATHMLTIDRPAELGKPVSPGQLAAMLLEKSIDDTDRSNRENNPTLSAIRANRPNCQNSHFSAGCTEGRDPQTTVKK